MLYSGAVRHRQWDKWAIFFVAASGTLFSAVAFLSMQNMTGWLINSAAWLAALCFVIALFLAYRSYEQDQREAMKRGEIPIRLPAYERVSIVESAMAFANAAQQSAESGKPLSAASEDLRVWNQDNGRPRHRIAVGFQDLQKAHGISEGALRVLQSSDDPLELARAARHGAHRICPRQLRGGYGLGSQDAEW